MKQVFFITDDRLMAMLWQGMQLIAKYEFKMDDNSVSSFRGYLQESREIESRVMVDVLEEEITLTEIPHVGPRERKFLIDRAKTRLHRGSEFAYARIIGRNKDNRRDDRLLISGLTNGRVLLRWLDVLTEENVNLKGVYSLPLVSDDLLKLIGNKKGLNLLVSRQSRGFIRQSVFKDGRLFYSRNIPSSQQFNIGTIASDLQKTRKYLQNQKLVSLEDSIDVLVLASDRFYDQLSGIDEMVPDMNLVYIRHQGLQKSLGIKSEHRIGGREIFSGLLLKSMTQNHYGRQPDLSINKQRKKNNLLNFTSIAAAIVFAMLSVKTYLDITVLDRKMDGLETQISSLVSHNRKLKADMSQLPVKAQQMKVFVENMQEIDTANKTSIENALVKMSQVFNAYQSVALVDISWYINNASYKGPVSNSRYRKNVSQPQKAGEGQLLEITAAIDLSEMGNEQAMSTIDRFVESLKNIDTVEKVSLVKTPLNDSSNTRISGVMSEGKAKKKGEFALTLQLVGGEHAG